MGKGSVDRRLFLGAGASLTALTVSGCGFNGGSSSETSESDGDADSSGPSGSIRFAHGSTIDSLDPHYVNQAMIVVPSGLLEGLVLANEDNTDVVPGAAESWEMSEDGTVYTFTMRSGAVWSNGDPVTAQDAEWSFQRLLSPTGASTNYAVGASSYLTGLGIKGATDHLSGTNEDWESVGISAPDEQTLVVELDAPNADFLLLMSHYSMLLVHPPSVEEDSEEWMLPENWVGNGAYVLESWEPTASIRMRANESYWDYDNVGVQEVELVLGMDRTAAMASFGSQDLDLVVADATTVDQRDDLADQTVEIEGYSVVYLQRMWGGHEASQDVNVRRALSMALDREAIASVSAGDTAGTTLIPGNVVPGWDESVAISFDPDRARDLMAEAGLTDVPNLRIQFSIDEPWLPVVADQWEEVFGTTVSVDIVEGGVHGETRWQPYDDEETISFYAGRFSGISTMSNWVNNIFGPDYVMQFSLSTSEWLQYQELEEDESLDDAERAGALDAFLREHADSDAVRFADLAGQARSTVDDAERLATFLEAVQIREDLANTLPIAWSSRVLLAGDYISGFEPRPSPEVCYYKYLTVDE